PQASKIRGAVQSTSAPRALDWTQARDRLCEPACSPAGSVAPVAEEQLQIVPSVQVQLVVHVVQVDFDGPDADRQTLCDLLIIQFERHQAQDLQLASTQQVAQ